MTEEAIRAREKELRKRYPASFTHPELKEGEMCTGEYIPDDFPQNTIADLIKQGFQARLSRPMFRPGISVQTIIVNVREQILAGERTGMISA